MWRHFHAVRQKIESVKIVNFIKYFIFLIFHKKIKKSRNSQNCHLMTETNKMDFWASERSGYGGLGSRTRKSTKNDDLHW